MKPLVLGLVLSLAVVTSASGEDEQFTKPIRYTWVASSATTWESAAAALVAAAGDPYVLALPTGDAERPWLILRRVEAGSVYIPPEEPFIAEVFAHLDGATAQYVTLDSSKFPSALTVPGGGAVVFYRRFESTRKRAVRH